jgi:hypothetical protein
MAIPSLVFIDTCVFERQHFDFESTLIASFVEAARERKVKLLMPDPTRGEIVRHMEARTEEALQALETVRRKVPFLRAAGLMADAKLLPTQQVAIQHLRTFLDRLADVDFMNYQSVDLARVMHWYESKTAPFGDGKKRKEFPDAIVIEMLSQYAENSDHPIAVVSHDGDMKRACERYASLLHFEGLASLTELLLVQDEHEQKLLGLVAESHDILLDSLKEAAGGFLFVHIDSTHFKVRDSTLAAAYLRDAHVVGIGEGVCTVVFEAVAEFNHEIDWVEWLDEDDREWRTETFLEDHLVRGSAKLAFNPDATEVTGVSAFSLEQTVFQVSEKPTRW